MACCDGCASGNGCGGTALGTYAYYPYGSYGYGTPYSPYSPFGGDPWGGGGGGLQGTGGGSGLPLDYAAQREWYDPILDVLGDAGSRVLEEVKDYLARWLGREAWDRMPQASKEEAVRTAVAELGSRTVSVSLPWIIGGGLAFLLLLRR